MPPDASDRLAGLGDFLAALRLNGVPVGPGEIERLRHLFACSPCLDRAGLRSLLAALLVKTPAQRQTFDGLFAAWCPDHDADWPTDEPANARSPAATAPDARQRERDRSPFAPPRPPLPPDLWKRLLVIGAALLLLVALAWSLWPPDPPADVRIRELSVRPEPPAGQPNLDPELPDQPVERFWTWRIDDIPPAAIRVPNRLGPLPLALLGVLALALALALRWRYRREFPLITATPQAYRGFGWQPLPPPPRDDGALIDARARRQLVWNIERFVADGPTRRLDLPRTVEQSARAGGCVRFCFQPAVYERAVWFWIDRHLASPTAKEIAAQLGATLRAAGLESRLGFFTDAPQRIDWSEQPDYRPLAEEGSGRQALVAIFPDGAGLRRRLEHPLHRVETRRLLGALQHWPRLAFVDCSPGGDQLAALFAAQDLRLEVVALPQLPDWLGAVDKPAVPAAAADDGPPAALRQWAAVVAFGGGEADAATAQTLRAALALPASSWGVDAVLAAAAQPEDRRRLINWLLRSEPCDGQTLHVHSLARQALTWWQARYAAADEEKRTHENPLLPWRDSLASRRWQVEHALLQLYTEPEAAADRLTKLADEALRPEIEHRLREFAAADHRPADRDDDGARVYLNWRFADLKKATTRHRLRQLGFAAGLYQSTAPPLQEAPRLVLATALLGSLALAAWAVAAHRLLAEHPPRLLVSDPIHDHPTLAAQTLRIAEASGTNAYQLTLGSARASVTLPQIPAGAEVALDWRWAESENAVLVAGGGVLLRAGSLAQPIRACANGWPKRSLAVIAAPYTDRAARQLAIRLLDKGSADQVLAAADWADLFDEWRGSSDELNRHTQVLLILPHAREHATAERRLADHPGPWGIVSAGDLAALARAVDFSGAKPIAQARLPWRVLATRGEARVYGGPETTTKNGIEWVSICPGSFTMGPDSFPMASRKGEAMAEQREIVEPARVVTLSRFEITASETTNRQYARTVTGHEKRDELPVIELSRKEARSFCRHLGGDLPSEAQWEYAARGGSRSAWSFGDDKSQLGRHAWFSGNSGDQAHQVRQKRPNPLGLYDMHGNVEEWTRDGVARYQPGSFVDPDGANDGQWQILRGGSFGHPPEMSRSASRNYGNPEFRLGFDGFRCVRAPPQP